MYKNIELKHYRIPQIQADFEKLPKGKQNIKIEIQVSIKMPEDKNTNKKNIVEITPIFYTDDQVEILKAKIQGQFELLNEEALSDDEKGKVLETEAVPVLYLKLEEYFDKFLKISNINFISLPPYEVEDEE